MQRFALRLIASAAAVLLASYLFGEHLRVGSPEGALLFALVLGVLNAFVRPILLLLTLPLTLLTLGLFTFVINAFVFWLASLVPIPGGVTVTSVWGSLLGALLVSVVSFIASRALR